MDMLWEVFDIRDNSWEDLTKEVLSYLFGS